MYLRIQQRKKYALLEKEKQEKKEKEEKEERENAKRISPEKRLLNDSPDYLIVNESVTISRSQKNFVSTPKPIFFEVDTIRTVMREKSLVLPTITENTVTGAKLRKKLSSIADKVFFYDPRNDYFLNDDITVKRSSTTKKETIIQIKPPNRVPDETAVSSEVPLINEVFTIKRSDSRLEVPILSSNTNITETIVDKTDKIPLISNKVTENKLPSDLSIMANPTVIPIINPNIKQELVRPTSTKSIISVKSTKSNKSFKSVKSVGSAKSVKSAKSVFSKNSTISKDLKDGKLISISEKPMLLENRHSDHVTNIVPTLAKEPLNLQVNNELLRATSAKSVKSFKSISSFKASELDLNIENELITSPPSAISIKSSTHEQLVLESVINNQLPRLNSARSIESPKRAKTTTSNLEAPDVVSTLPIDVKSHNSSTSISNSATVSNSQVDESLHNLKLEMQKSNSEKPVSIDETVEEPNLKNEQIATTSIFNEEYPRFNSPLSVKFPLPEISTQAQVHTVDKNNSIEDCDSLTEKLSIKEVFGRYQSAKSLKSIKSINTLISPTQSEMGDTNEDPETIIIKRPNQSAYRNKTKAKREKRIEINNNIESSEQK